MTQMGLDYQKHLENMRHNLRSEEINQQDADTRAFTSSFKEREVLASEKQADASSKQADAAAKKADQYGRELDIKQAAVDATNRGNTLKNLNTNKIDVPVLGSLTLALPYLISEGLLTTREGKMIGEIFNQVDSTNADRQDSINVAKVINGDPTEMSKLVDKLERITHTGKYKDTK